MLHAGVQQLPLSLQLAVGRAVGTSHGFRLPAATALCIQGGLPHRNNGVGHLRRGGQWGCLGLPVLPCCPQGCPGIQAPSALPCVSQWSAAEAKWVNFTVKAWSELRPSSCTQGDSSWCAPQSVSLVLAAGWQATQLASAKCW